MLELRSLMEDSLEVLRTYRHDLMNQVQLIHSYSQMKKYDRLQGPIQNLIAEARRHTEMSAIASSMISYVVLSRDICYPMLQVHATCEQAELPTLSIESKAAELLFDLLNMVGQHSMRQFEPLRLDLSIVLWGQAFEIGWHYDRSEHIEDVPDFSRWGEAWAPQGIVMKQHQEEAGIEYSIRFQVQE